MDEIETCCQCDSPIADDGWCSNDECVTNEYTSGADYMGSYYNSDSYINYLNG